MLQITGTLFIMVLKPLPLEGGKKEKLAVLVTVHFVYF